MPDLTPTPEGGDDNDVELAELRAFAARVGPGSVEWETPPPELWDRISAAASGGKVVITADAEDQRPTDVPTDQAAVVPIEQLADRPRNALNLPAGTAPAHRGSSPRPRSSSA